MNELELNPLEEARCLAKKYNASVLECVKHGKISAYKVVLNNSKIVVVFKNRDGGAL